MSTGLLTLVTFDTISLTKASLNSICHKPSFGVLPPYDDNKYPVAFHANCVC